MAHTLNKNKEYKVLAKLNVVWVSKVTSIYKP